jgi:large subunit ribosomal protein L10
LDRTQKEEQVAYLNNIFSEAEVLIVTQNKGLSVSEVTDLRNKMRNAGGRFKVAKNRLVKLALKDTRYNHIAEMFAGPTALAYSDDVIAAPKILSTFAKSNDKLIIIGGAMGDTLLDEKGIDALASLPSLDELRSKLLSMINTPATRIAGILQAPAGQIARVISSHANSETQN